MEGVPSLPPNLSLLRSRPNLILALVMSSGLSVSDMVVEGSCLPNGRGSHIVRTGPLFCIALFEQGTQIGPGRLLEY